jgi:hypothetical protein
MKGVSRAATGRGTAQVTLVPYCALCECRSRARVRLVSLSGRAVLGRTDTRPVVGSSVLGRTSQPRVGSGERRFSKFVGLHDEQTVAGFLVSAKEKAPHQERHAGADPWGQKSRCFGRGDDSVGLSTSYRGAVGPRGSRNGPKDRARPLLCGAGGFTAAPPHTYVIAAGPLGNHSRIIWVNVQGPALLPPGPAISARERFFIAGLLCRRGRRLPQRRPEERLFPSVQFCLAKTGRRLIRASPEFQKEGKQIRDAPTGLHREAVPVNG